MLLQVENPKRNFAEEQNSEAGPSHSPCSRPSLFTNIFSQIGNNFKTMPNVPKMVNLIKNVKLKFKTISKKIKNLIIV